MRLRDFLKFAALPAVILLCSPVLIAREETAVASDARSRFDAYVSKADSASNYMEVSRWDDAARCLKEALRLQPATPTNAMLFSNLGVCQSNLGDYDDALMSFEIALVKSPGNPSVLLNRARTYLAMSREQEAMADLNAVVSADSLHNEALTLRSALLLKQGDYSKALPDLSRLHDASPDAAWPLAAMGQCHDALGDKSEADKCFASVLQLDPDAESFIAAIIHYISTDNLNAADEAVYQSLKKYPREGMLYLLRGVLHKRRFQNEEAEIDKKLAKNYGVDSELIESFLPSQKK